jgi:DNA-binding PadR family transcriptional regulator
MSVRQGLLALLDRAPSYGYQLRADFEQRTGGTWPLNIGQVYSTLDRLERDGLVENEGADDEGHVMWAITPDGRTAVAAWLSSPVERSVQNRDELAVKFALADTMPDLDVQELVQTQRTATLRHLQDLTRTKSAAGPASDDIAWSLVIEGMIFQAEAEARWLDHVEAQLLRARRAPSPAVVSVPAPSATESVR